MAKELKYIFYLGKNKEGDIEYQELMGMNDIKKKDIRRVFVSLLPKFFNSQETPVETPNDSEL